MKARQVALLVGLLLVSILCQLDRVLPFVLAESIKSDLGLSDTQLGLVAGMAFSLCHSLLGIPVARLADRGSPKLVLLGCIVVWSAMTAWSGWATSFLFLACTRIGVAIGEAGAIPAGHALIARTIEPEGRGRAIGLFSMGIPLGAMLGFILGGRLNDLVGWRMVMTGAGLAGGLVAGLFWILAPTPPSAGPVYKEAQLSDVRSSLKLLASPAFRWLFIAAIAVGFASAPFYIFGVPFLIRSHGYLAGEVGPAFGLLQGIAGIVGAVVGGRRFDRALKSGRGLLFEPAIMLLLSTFTTLAALFVPSGWLSLLLFVPSMLSISFLLPWAFGAAHWAAGPGQQALASSRVLMGSGLFGPTLGPLFVGQVSDALGSGDGLRWGLLIVPLASLLAALACLVANRRLRSAASASNGKERMSA